MASTWNSNGADTGGSGAYVSGTQGVSYILSTFAAAGDTITIPSGSFTWNTGVTINKQITLQGAGQTLSTITRGTLADPTPLVGISNLPDDTKLTRVTALKFDDPNHINPSGLHSRFPHVGISNSNSNPTFGYTKIRVDNCTFHGGSQGVYWSGWAYGVVDHCTFNDCLNSILCDGIQGDDGDAAWARNDFAAGTASFPFIEDCTFNLTNAIAFPNSPWAIFTDEGGRWVCRKCTFDTTANTSSSIEGIIDFHGNNNYWANTSSDYRSSIRMEFYGNTIKTNNAFRNMDMRGGSSIIHDNNFIYGNGIMPAIVSYREEEIDPSEGGFGPPNTRSATGPWPAEDQVSASFIYNNKINGNPNDLWEVDTTPVDSSIYIQKGRDFWVGVSPSAATVWTYPPPGPPSLTTYPVAQLNSLATTSYPSNSLGGGYVYPHPLVSTVSGLPQITSINPTSGTAAGGTTVTLTGQGFTGVSGVKFGSTPGTSVTFVSDTSVTVVSPAALVGQVDITLAVNNNISPTGSGDKYTYTSTGSIPAITSISPNTGIPGGGTSVAITGTGFTGVSDVLFGTTAASSFAVNTDVGITAVSPAQAAGAVDIRLKLPTKTGSGDQFAYTSGSTKQVIQSKTGNMGADGTTTTIAFANNVANGSLIAVAVNLNGTAATVSGMQDNINGAGKPYSKAIAGGSNPRSEIWYLPNSGPGAVTVTITFSATVPTSTEDMYIYEVSNCATSSPVEVTNSSSGSGTSVTSGTITTTNTNDFILSCTAVGGSVTAGESGWTLITNSNGDASEAIVVTTAQTNKAATYTQDSSASYVSVIAAFK